MECEVMSALKLYENEARIRLRESKEFELQMLFGQACLEAKRLQTNHWNHCEICQSGPRVTV